MGRQSFTLKQTAIDGDELLDIPRNHLDIEHVQRATSVDLRQGSSGASL